MAYSGQKWTIINKQQNQDFGMGPGVQMGVNFVIENKSHLGRRGWKKYKKTITLGTFVHTSQNLDDHNAFDSLFVCLLSLW